MPYHKTMKPKGKKTYRKKNVSAPKKYRKGTRRNDSAYSTIRGPQIPDTMSVRFNWRSTTVSAVDSYTTGTNVFWVGNQIYPAPQNLPSSVTPGTGDIGPPNLAQFAGMYQEAVVTGSAIKLRLQVMQVAAVPSVYIPALNCVLVALPFDADNTVSVVTGAFAALGFDDACALPYAHIFTLDGNTGSPTSGHYYKGYRKTKLICGLTNIKDDQELATTVSTNSATINPVTKGFLWCLKMVNPLGMSNTSRIQIQNAMVLYTFLRERISTPQAVLT